MQCNKYSNRMRQDLGRLEKRAINYCCPAGIEKSSQEKWHLGPGCWRMDKILASLGDRPTGISDFRQNTLPYHSKRASWICVKQLVRTWDIRNAENSRLNKLKNWIIKLGPKLEHDGDTGLKREILFIVCYIWSVLWYSCSQSPKS